ncbi:MAG: hypothetical protein DRH37_11850, partial [Deltaproteobacteria bacterium]
TVAFKALPPAILRQEADHQHGNNQTDPFDLCVSCHCHSTSCNIIPKTCINCFQKGSYAFNISKLWENPIQARTKIPGFEPYGKNGCDNPFFNASVYPCSNVLSKRFSLAYRQNDTHRFPALSRIQNQLPVIEKPSCLTVTFSKPKFNVFSLTVRAGGI